MVASGRQARSAKNRLSRTRVDVPVSLASVQLPTGCLVAAKDIDELVHGESALQQLCALKSIVAALGIVKGKVKASADAIGLAEVVAAVVDILPAPGAKCLHDEIRVLLEGLPDEICRHVVERLVPKLTAISTWEMLLAVGVLCKVSAAQPILQIHLASLVVASSVALDTLSASLSWSDAHSVRAQVDDVISNTSAIETLVDPKGYVGNNTSGSKAVASVVEPEMPAYVLNALIDLLTVTSDHLTAAVIELVEEHETPGAVAVQTLMESLLRFLDNEAAQKDALTPCAIVLCTLINRSHHAREAVAAQLAVAAGCHCKIDLSAYSEYFSGVVGPSRPLVTVGDKAGCVSLDQEGLKPFARQALMRAALSSASQHILLAPLAVRYDDASGREGSLMFSLIYDRIIQQCSTTADLFFICYGLQSLAYGIDVARQALRDIISGAPEAPPPSAVPVSVVETMCSDGIRLLWPHCEDPFQGIVDQTKAMFDSLISLSELADELRLFQHPAGGVPRPALEQHKDLLDLALAVKPNRKARYRVLVALVPRIGVTDLLAKDPTLALSVLLAMRDQSVGSAAANLLETMLKTDCDKAWWLSPVLTALSDTDPKLRYGLSNYALPTIARVVPGGITALLESLQELPDCAQPTPSGGLAGDLGHLWAMTAVIKVARKWGASGEASSQNCAQPLPAAATAKVLRAALLHADDEMRLNALEMVCMHPKMTEPPTQAEVDLVQEFLSLNMKSSSSNYRQKCMELLKRLFLRMRMARAHIQTLVRKAERGVRNDKRQAFMMPAAHLLDLPERVDRFLRWLAEHLTAALFPGASFERNIMALELYVIAIDVWLPARARFPDPQIAELKCSDDDLLHIEQALFQPKATHAVINCIVNSFDYVRKQAVEVLWRFPAPLPGVADRPSLLALLRWSESLVNSPRARESDAGSLIVKIVYQKYVKELGWYLSPFPASDAMAPVDPPADPTLSPAIFFLQRLSEGIKRRIDEAETNLESTFASSFAQGLLLTLRQVLPDIQREMPSLNATHRQHQLDQPVLQIWRDLLAQILGRLRTIAGIAIRAMAGCPPERVGGGGVSGGGERPLVLGGAAVSTGLFGSMYRKETEALDALPTPHSVQRDALSSTQRNTNSALAVGAHPRHAHVDTAHSLSQELGGGGGAGDEEDSDEAKLARLGPKEQLLVVSCWLTLKEVGLCVASCVAGAGLESDAYLNRTQLIVCGNLLLDIIFSTLHNGAIEKARLGFQRLCDKLLRCPRRDLRGLPAEWLERLLQRLFAHDVPVVRRSSQLSFSILAILDAEVPNTHRALLERVMRFLLAVAKGLPPPAGLALDDDAPSALAGAPAAAAAPSEGAEVGTSLRAQVHALNVLRHVFLDTNLAKEVSSYIPEAMLCALEGFGAESWAVRNSSTLAFSVLLSRSMGGAAQRKSFGAAEFFLRYPALCPALVARLAGAVSAEGCQGEMHPELQPVLVLLAQLAPSQHVRLDQSHLDAFVPLVRRCLGFQNQMVRMMAARSLHPFVPVQAVPSFVVRELLGQLPGRYRTPAPRALANHNHVQGVLEAVRWLVKLNTVREESWPDILASLAGGHDWHVLCQALCSHLDWVLDQRLPPPMRLILLRTVSDVLWSPGGGSLLLGVARHHQGAAADLRDKTLTVCRALLDTQSQLNPVDSEPMLDALMGQAVRLAARQSLLMAAASAQSEAEQCTSVEFAIALTCRARYEERYMALRAVKESVLGRLGLPALNGPCRSLLHEALLARLACETHAAGCQRKLMRVLIELGRLPEGLSAAALATLWTRVQELALAADPKVRERGLVLSGEVVAARLRLELQKSGGLEQAGFSTEPTGGVQALVATLATWLALVEEHGDETRHVDERFAAVGALCRSGILQVSRASVHDMDHRTWLELRTILVRAWRMALLLLQDDDEEARCMMAQAVSAAATAGGAGGEAGQTVVGVQAAKAIEVAFVHISGPDVGSHAGAWHEFLQTTLESKVAGVGGGQEVLEGGEVLSDEAMARRLFEKECDNFQAEEMLMVQLSALHLRRLGSTALADKRSSKAAAALARLDAQASDLQAQASGRKESSWAGGVTSRMDVFLNTYRLILACYAWGVGGSPEERDRLGRIAAGLQQVDAHPLLVHAVRMVSCASESAPLACHRVVSEEGLPLLWLTSATA